MPYFLDIVKQLEYKSDSERRSIIINFLKSKKIKYKLEEYSFFGRTGINIIVEFGKGRKYSIASAHYDVIPRSPGANDDASAIAVLFKIVEKLEKTKLNTRKSKIRENQRFSVSLRNSKNFKEIFGTNSIGNKIKIIFFDDEETGRLGSISYIRKHGLKNLIGIYHMELVGMGDTLGFWPITSFNKDSYILKEIEDVAKEKNIYTERVGQLPAFYGDDLSFREFGFKHAICISVAYKKDKEKIKKFVKSSIPSIILKYCLGFVPKMFKLYHSPEDKSKYLNESAMEITSDVLLGALISLDEKF